jgi:hypothetical protein
VTRALLHVNVFHPDRTGDDLFLARDVIGTRLAIDGSPLDGHTLVRDRHLQRRLRGDHILLDADLTSFDGAPRRGELFLMDRHTESFLPGRAVIR